MLSNMAYLSRIQPVSGGSFTSFGSNDTVLTGFEPLQINSSVFLNNITYGARWDYMLGIVCMLELCEAFHIFFCFQRIVTITVNEQHDTIVFCRLEMLQQIANRVQRDCVNGEDKLALARTSLQSVSSAQALSLLMWFIIKKIVYLDFHFPFVRMSNVLSPVFSSSMKLRLPATSWSVRISSDNKWWTSRFS